MPRRAAELNATKTKGQSVNQPSEQWGCDEIVGTPVPRIAAVSFENGVTHASGNQSSCSLVMPVCSPTQRARSANVNHFASSSCLPMRPVNATG